MGYGQALTPQLPAWTTLPESEWPDRHLILASMLASWPHDVAYELHVISSLSWSVQATLRAHGRSDVYIDVLRHQGRVILRYGWPQCDHVASYFYVDGISDGARLCSALTLLAPCFRSDCNSLK